MGVVWCAGLGDGGCSPVRVNLLHTQDLKMPVDCSALAASGLPIVWVLGGPGCGKVWFHSPVLWRFAQGGGCLWLRAWKEPDRHHGVWPARTSGHCPGSLG